MCEEDGGEGVDDRAEPGAGECGRVVFGFDQVGFICLQAGSELL
jgi:hypothetical protein